MDIMIKETNEIVTLSIIDADTGVNYIDDFVGGGIDYDHEREMHVCDRETFEWWQNVVLSNQELNNRIADMTSVHGSQVVQDAISNINCDIDDYAVLANQALDELA